MPRVTTVQSNFTTGEITPRLYGRTDIDRYNNAARTLVNAHPVVHGGAKRRGGTRFYKATKLAAKTARLIPFIKGRDEAYMLEVGDNYLRVHAAGGVDMGVELATSYPEALLGGIDYAHGADTMFMFHEAVTPQKLLRLAPTSWTLGAAAFINVPYDDTGASPAATITPSADGPVGQTIYLIAGEPTGGRVNIAALGWTDGFATYQTAAAHGLASGDAVVISSNVPVAYNLTSVVTVADATHFSVPIRDDPGTGAAAGTEVGRLTKVVPAPVFSGADVGKVVKINGGLVKITAFINSGVVQGVIEQALTSAVQCPQDAWSVHAPAWSAGNGYPRTGTLFEQRLVAAGSPAYPQTLWGSAIAGYLDFLQGTSDDDAYSFTLASNEVNPISYVTSLRNLVVLTYGGEFSVQGGVEKPITPTNIRVRGETNFGSKDVRPVLVGKESIFVQRSGRKVRSLGYRTGEDDYSAPDLTVFAEHLTQSYAVSGLAFQQEPEQLLWAPREDGAFLSATIDRDQTVLGWSPHYTEGAVESMATIPNGDRDETWLIVRRTVNGATVRYLEIMDETFEPLLPGSAPTGYPPYADPIVYGYTVDCGMSFDNAGGQTTFAVPHLIGCTVDIVADGSVQPAQLVPVSGNVTIPRAAKRTLIGLHFDSKVGLLTPEIGTGTGSAQGNSMRTSEVTMRFLNTLGAKILDGDDQEQDVPFRQFGAGVLDAVPQPFTGEVRIETLGWERGRSEFTIVQDQPLPMHLLSVIRKFQVND